MAKIIFGDLNLLDLFEKAHGAVVYSYDIYCNTGDEMAASAVLAECVVLRTRIEEIENTARQALAACDLEKEKDR